MDNTMNGFLESTYSDKVYAVQKCRWNKRLKGDISELKGSDLTLMNLMTYLNETELFYQNIIQNIMCDNDITDMPYKRGPLKGQLTSAELRRLVRAHNKLVDIKIPPKSTRDDILKLIDTNGYRVDHEAEKIRPKAGQTTVQKPTVDLPPPAVRKPRTTLTEAQLLAKYGGHGVTFLNEHLDKMKGTSKAGGGSKGAKLLKIQKFKGLSGLPANASTKKAVVKKAPKKEAPVKKPPVIKKVVPKKPDVDPYAVSPEQQARNDKEDKLMGMMEATFDSLTANQNKGLSPDKVDKFSKVVDKVFTELTELGGFDKLEPRFTKVGQKILNLLVKNTPSPDKNDGVMIELKKAPYKKYKSFVSERSLLDRRNILEKPARDKKKAEAPKKEAPVKKKLTQKEEDDAFFDKRKRKPKSKPVKKELVMDQGILRQRKVVVKKEAPKKVAPPPKKEKEQEKPVDDDVEHIDAQNNDHVKRLRMIIKDQSKKMLEKASKLKTRQELSRKVIDDAVARLGTIRDGYEERFKVDFSTKVDEKIVGEAQELLEADLLTMMKRMKK